MASIQKLTKAEEEIMHYFWDSGPSTVSALIDKMEQPHPPHSTISSIVRILESKGFLNHKAYGRTYEYFPLIDKKAYSRFSLKKLVSNYFEGSMNELVSFLVKDDQVDVDELNQLINRLEDDDQ